MNWKTIFTMLFFAAVLAFFVAVQLPAAPTVEEQGRGVTNDLIKLIGTHGIVAIFGTIFLVRFIASATYFSKPVLFVITMLISATVGSLSVYFWVPDATLKDIEAGAFMTCLVAPIVYELMKLSLKWLIATNRGTEKEEFYQGVYWFLTPKPIEIKEKDKSTGQKRKVVLPPHEGLTDATQFTRLDKHFGREDKTRVMSPEEKPDYDPEERTDRRRDR